MPRGFCRLLFSRITLLPTRGQNLGFGECLESLRFGLPWSPASPMSKDKSLLTFAASSVRARSSAHRTLDGRRYREKKAFDAA